MTTNGNTTTTDEKATAGDRPAEERAAESNGSLRDAAPGLARIALTAWWRTAGWAAEASIRTSSRVMRAAISGENPADLFSEAGAEIREAARRLLGLMDGGDSDTAEHRNGAREPATSADVLRERGAELLRQSADVNYEEESHPAYERILEVLSPDEARVLRLLAQSGPQPAVDVRSGLPLATTLVAGGLTMIGQEAGCRHLDRVHAYLNNLFRLGLIWFSRESLEDPLRYQVLEAQPEVIAPLKEAGRTGRTVRRTIHLTPFGQDFCEVCIPFDTGEFEAMVQVPGGGPVEPSPVPNPPQSAKAPPSEPSATPEPPTAFG